MFQGAGPRINWASKQREAHSSALDNGSRLLTRNRGFKAHSINKMVALWLNICIWGLCRFEISSYFNSIALNGSEYKQK